VGVFSMTERSPKYLCVGVVALLILFSSSMYFPRYISVGVGGTVGCEYMEKNVNGKNVYIRVHNLRASDAARLCRASDAVRLCRASDAARLCRVVLKMDFMISIGCSMI